jgi:acetyl esterase/lipase
MTKKLDQVYRESDGVTLRYDAFLSPSPRAAVVCIHGGGWVSGDRSDYHDIAEFFAANGFNAYCPQYRLAPLYPFPAAVDDCRAFVAFLRAGGESPLAAFGNSAGGHLSSMLAMSPNVEERVDAAVDVCGLADLTNPETGHPMIAWDFIGQFMGTAFQGNEALWIQASPIYQITPQTAPLLIFHGTNDDIVWKAQSEKLYDALSAQGLQAKLTLLENEGHSFTPEGFQRILEESIAFFEEKLPQAVRS